MFDEPVRAQLLRDGLRSRCHHVKEDACVHDCDRPGVLLMEEGEEVRLTERAEPTRKRFAFEVPSWSLGERDEVELGPQLVGRKVSATAKENAASVWVFDGDAVDQGARKALATSVRGDDQLNDADLIAREVVEDVCHDHAAEGGRQERALLSALSESGVGKEADGCFGSPAQSYDGGELVRSFRWTDEHDPVCRRALGAHDARTLRRVMRRERRYT